MAEREQIIGTTQQTLQEFRAKYPKIVGAFIYGSFAKGTFTDQSDVDIALLTNGQFSSFGNIEDRSDTARLSV